MPISKLGILIYNRQISIIIDYSTELIIIIARTILPIYIIMQEQNQVGLEQLIKALPIEERVPVVALKAHYDDRQLLDQQQEAQLEVVRRKYNELVKPILERVTLSSSRPHKSSAEAYLQLKKFQL